MEPTWSLMEPPEVSWGVLGSLLVFPGASYRLLEPPRTPWGSLEFHGPPLELPGPLPTQYAPGGENLDHASRVSAQSVQLLSFNSLRTILKLLGNCLKAMKTIVDPTPKSSLGRPR